MAAIQPFALSNGGWCAINYTGGNVWFGQTPATQDGILVFQVNQENYPYTAFPGDAIPCQGQNTYQPLVREDVSVQCPGNEFRRLDAGV